MTGWFDATLAAADRLDGAQHILTTSQADDLLLALRGLREAVAMLRGLTAENTELKRKLAENPETFALSQADPSALVAEVRRRMRVGAS